MLTPDPTIGAQNVALPAPSSPGPLSAEDTPGFSFHDLLNIVNPLQHLPVISTIYRAITHDTIKPFEKIAGDTIYGGPMGFIGSLADTIFQKITGKDFGDTVLSLFTGSHDAAATSVAQSSSSATAGVSPQTDIASPDMSALMTSMSQNGIDPSLAKRAAAAYRRAVDLSAAPMATPALRLQPAT
jgi:hypothetical protein